MPAGGEREKELEILVGYKQSFGEDVILQS